MFLSILLFSCVICMTTSSITFDAYVKSQGKFYGSSEYELRKSIFENNLEKINTHNENNNKRYTMGINKFTDMKEEELIFYKGFNNAESIIRKSASTSYSSIVAKKRRNLSLPASVDWSKSGHVTAVKDQGHCGSCWAFATVALVESHVSISTGKLMDLSTQELVSCSPNPNHCGGTGGCEGSIPELAMDYIHEHGLTSEWQYGYSSYQGVESACDMEKKSPVIFIDGHHKLPANDQIAIMHTLANVGPLAVNVDASNWHFYESGIYDNCNITHPVINHVVVLVGYGSDEKLGDYWKIRNSWSPSFGENGYIRLKRTAPVDLECGTDTEPGQGTACDSDLNPQHVCGQCGVLFDASYPLNPRLA